MAPAPAAPAPADEFSLDFDLPTDLPVEAPEVETAPPTLIEAPLPLEDLALEDEPEALPELPDSIQTVEEALADLEESIELPDGRRIPDYYVFEYPDWVNVIAITKEGKFVFIDQYRHGLGETDYEIPAGVAEPDDASMLAAAQRELAEETGYGGDRKSVV